MDDANAKPVIVQARVTLDETVHIPALSKKEVPTRINKQLRNGVWVLEGDHSGRLPVSVANALVNVTVCMTNNQCEPVVVFLSAPRWESSKKQPAQSDSSSGTWDTGE